MQDQTEQALLAQLAERAGIAKDYYDIAGTLHHTSDDTRRAILTAMGYAIDSAASLTQALQEWDEAPWQRPCDPVRIRVMARQNVLCPVIWRSKMGEKGPSPWSGKSAMKRMPWCGKGRQVLDSLRQNVAFSKADDMSVSRYLPHVVFRSGTTRWWYERKVWLGGSWERCVSS